MVLIFIYLINKTMCTLISQKHASVKLMLEIPGKVAHRCSNIFFSTIPSFLPPLTQNWVYGRSDCLVVVVEKISFALRAPFPNSQMSKFCPCRNALAKKSGNSGHVILEKAKRTYLYRKTDGYGLEITPGKPPRCPARPPAPVPSRS